jgi:hypothetical protein
LRHRLKLGLKNAGFCCEIAGTKILKIWKNSETKNYANSAVHANSEISQKFTLLAQVTLIACVFKTYPDFRNF